MAMFMFNPDDVHLLHQLSNEHQMIMLSTRSMDKPSYRKISEQLGIPIGTVKSRISRARGNLDRLRAAQASHAPAANLSEAG